MPLDKVTKAWYNVNIGSGGNADALARATKKEIQMRCACGEKFLRSAYNFCPDCGRKVAKRNINTGGGAYIEGNVVTSGGDLVLGDKVVVQSIDRVDGPAVKIVLD